MTRLLITFGNEPRGRLWTTTDGDVRYDPGVALLVEHYAISPKLAGRKTPLTLSDGARFVELLPEALGQVPGYWKALREE